MAGRHSILSNPIDGRGALLLMHLTEPRRKPVVIHDDLWVVSPSESFVRSWRGNGSGRLRSVITIGDGGTRFGRLNCIPPSNFNGHSNQPTTIQKSNKTKTNITRARNNRSNGSQYTHVFFLFQCLLSVVHWHSDTSCYLY